MTLTIAFVEDSALLLTETDHISRYLGSKEDADIAKQLFVNHLLH